MSPDLGVAVQIHSITAEYAYIAAHPCPCGGQWRVSGQALLKDVQERYHDRVHVICRQCGRHGAFLFAIDFAHS